MEEDTRNNKRVERNPEERNVGTKGKCPKQGLTIVEDLTEGLSEGRENFTLKSVNNCQD